MKDKSKELYETDHYAWLQFGAEQAESFGLTEVKETLLEMSRNELRSLKSQIGRLILHLLKWKHQPNRRGRSWRSSIVDARRNIEDALELSPSLVPKAPEFAKQEYTRAVRAFHAETGLKKDFPKEPEFSWEELMDIDFFPE